jgi:WW domain-containing oxidoreductase
LTRAAPAPLPQFYARGLFASPLVTSWRGVPRKGAAGDAVRGWAWGLVTLAHSLLDWPLRRLSGGRLLAQTRCVPAAPLAYDASLASQLWELSADAAGLPRECRLAARGKR